MTKTESLPARNIIATLVFYDVLNWPLTSYEVYRYLIKFKKSGQEPNYSQIRSTLHSLQERGVLEKDRGFYCLEGRKKIIETRIEKDKQALKKWRLAQKRLSLLSKIPFVQAGFVSGSLGVGNVEEESDIDLLVIAERGHVWTVRFLLHFIYALLGWRRKGENTKNKVCLYQFLETGDLSLLSKSIYNVQIHAHFLPFYDRKDYTEMFCAQNKKATPCLNKAFIETKTPEYRTETALQHFFEWLLGGILGEGFENILGGLQKFKIKKTPTKGNENAWIKNGKLSFHPRTCPECLREKYQKRIEELNF